MRRLFSTKTAKSIGGWATSVQKSGGNVFVKVDDGSGAPVVQVVASRQIGQEVKVGCALSASGSEQKSRGAQQETELAAEKLTIWAHDSNPRYDVSPDNLRKKVHLRARNEQFAALLRARSAIFWETHQFFMNRDFVHIDTPKLTRNDCEGGGEVFDVRTSSDDDSEDLYLTVSSQLHLEAMVSRLSKVYTLGPAFRAEKQQSHAHLSEFHMLEAEVAFVESVDEICDLVESYLHHMVHHVHTNPKLLADARKIGQNLVDPGISSKKFPRITYDEAVEILKSRGEKVPSKSGFSKKNELEIVELHQNSPVFVTNYPADQKPFYMARNGDKSRSFDLLVPLVGELAGGSVREPDEVELKRRGCGIDWYLETRRRGQPSTAGFGVGFERMLQYLLGIGNIKDTVAFPRWHRHCQC